MEDFIKSMRKCLFEAFWDWVEKRKTTLGDKWLQFFETKGKDAEDSCNSALKIAGTAMWMFKVIVNCAVIARWGPDGPCR